MAFVYMYFLVGVVTTALIWLIKLLKSVPSDDLPLKDTLFRYIGWTILWPFVLFFTLPRYGLSTLFSVVEEDPFNLSNITESISKREEELHSIWQSPPPCSSIIETTGYDESNYQHLDAILAFDASDIESYIDKLNPQDEFRVLNQDAIIRRWLRQRSGDNKPTKIPEQLDRFNNTSTNLLFAGKGHAFCPTCNIKYPAENLQCTEDELSAGWNFKRVKCSNGHLLSVCKSIHLNMRST